MDSDRCEYFKKEEWVEILQHTKYSGDYYFTNSHTLNIKKNLNILNNFILKILITGANGTVGSDLVYFFQSIFVYAIYRSSNFVNKKLRSNRIKWIKHDLSEEIRVKINPNVIIHCAVTHEFKKNSKAEDYVNSNILSLQNLVKFAIKKKYKIF